MMVSQMVPLSAESVSPTLTRSREPKRCSPLGWMRIYLERLIMETESGPHQMCSHSTKLSVFVSVSPLSSHKRGVLLIWSHALNGMVVDDAQKAEHKHVGAGVASTRAQAPISIREIAFPEKIVGIRPGHGRDGAVRSDRDRVNEWPEQRPQSPRHSPTTCTCALPSVS